MALNAYIISFPDSPFIEDAFYTMASHYADKDMREDEIKVYTQMIEKFPENIGALNSYAWRMSELELNLEDALEKAQKAVELSADNPSSQANIIDTEAEVLWKLKRFDAAIATIERAIIIDGENQYFKDQKEKFIQSKKETGQPV
jgi:tetratricopeptide (TPR) repeat protein